MIKLKPIIESKYSVDQNLYHYTGIVKLFKIIKSNKLTTRQYYEKFKQYSFSFSRSKQWLYDTSIVEMFGVNNECAMVFNANKLSSKYKIYPYSFFNEFGRGEQEKSKLKYHEFEERILSKYPYMPNVKSYISGVCLSKRMIYNMDFLSVKYNFYMIDHLDDEYYFNEEYTSNLISKDRIDDKEYILNYFKDKIENDLKLKVTIV